MSLRRIVRQKFHLSQILYLILAAFLLPAIWYSVRTPFALIDDYNAWIILKLNEPEFLHDFIGDLFQFGPGRYRPIFHLYNLITWFLFRENYALHHLARMAVKFTIAGLTLMTVRVWYPQHGKRFQLSTFAFLSIFFFLPNNPEARLAPQELPLVLGAAWFLYAFSVTLVKENGLIVRRPGWYASLLLAFIVLNGSKESAVALSGVFLLSLIVLNLKGIRNLAGVIPFVIVFTFSLMKSLSEYQAGGYGVARVSKDLILKNLEWYSSQLLLSHVSPSKVSFFFPFFLLFPALLAAVFAGREGFLLMSHSHRVEEPAALVPGSIHRPDWKRPLFIANLFFAGLASFAILLTSANLALRYLYPTLYLLVALVALGYAGLAPYLRASRKWVFGSVILGCFCLVWANYYNFVYQFATQYYTRKNEANMLSAVTDLLEQNKTVYVEITGEFESKIRSYYQHYLPYFRGIRFDNIRFVSHNELYDDRMYYLTRVNIPLGGHELRDRFLTAHTAPFLDWVKRLSSPRGMDPFVQVDAGASRIGEGQWYIFENMLPRAIWAGAKTIFTSASPIELGHGPEGDARSIPLSVSLEPSHYYAILARYSTSENARPYIMITRLPYDDSNVLLKQHIPAVKTEITIRLTFKPPRPDTSPSLIVFKNASKGGSYHISAFEIRDLGEVKSSP